MVDKNSVVDEISGIDEISSNPQPMNFHISLYVGHTIIQASIDTRSLDQVYC